MSASEKPVRIAIVGTGGMAGAHAIHLSKIPGVSVAAICDVDPARLAAFARAHAVKRTYTELDAMLDDGGFDGVCNVTPDAFHHALSLKIIDAGYPILCEKPLATNHRDAVGMTEAARRRGVINMVNFTYRNAAALQGAARRVAQGEIGEIVHFEAHYHQSWLTANYWGDYRVTPGFHWRLSKAHGSKGVLGDIGVHLIDFVNFASGKEMSLLHCALGCFPKDVVDGYVFDANDSAILTTRMGNGALGTLQMTRWASGEKNTIRLRLYGTKGGIAIDLGRTWNSFRICKGEGLDDAQWKTVRCPPTPNMWERFVRSIRTGENDQPDFATGTAVQKLLDDAFEHAEIGSRPGIKR